MATAANLEPLPLPGTPQEPQERTPRQRILRKSPSPTKEREVPPPPRLLIPSASSRKIPATRNLIEIRQSATLLGASPHLRQRLLQAPNQPFHSPQPLRPQVSLPLRGLTRASRKTGRPFRVGSHSALKDRNSANHAIVGSVSPGIVPEIPVTGIRVTVTPATVTRVIVILSKRRRPHNVPTCHALSQMRSMKFGK